MKKFVTVLVIITFVLGLAACGGNDDKKTPSDPTANEIITITIPADVILAGVGGFHNGAPNFVDIKPGDSLDYFRKSYKLNSAEWEKNGDLTISMTRKENESRLESIKELTLRGMNELTNRTSSSYVYFLYSVEMLDDLSGIVFLVDGESYKREKKKGYSNEIFTIKFERHYYPSQYQVFSNVEEYGVLSIIIDHDTNEVLDTHLWPDGTSPKIQSSYNK